MPQWPATLPQAAFSSLAEEPQDTTVRSENDSGPAFVRRRFTAAVRKFPLMMTLHRAEVQILDDFFHTDCGGGSLAFDWINPRTLAPASLRFVGPIKPARLSGPYFNVSFSVEILP